MEALCAKALARAEGSWEEERQQPAAMALHRAQSRVDWKHCLFDGCKWARAWECCQPGVPDYPGQTGQRLSSIIK
jgi:hypothetical protein